MRAKNLAATALPCAALIAALAAPANAQDTQAGKATYDKWCAGCHGVKGDATGPGAGHMLPKPRDFTKGLYQVRTTASGELPTDADILHVIDNGMPGTAMPGWRETLSQNERNALVQYVKTFSSFFQGEAPKALDFGKAPRATPERIAEGKEFYDKIECWKCHGRAGRGEGQSAPTQTDDYGFPIRPADLTEPWHFNGGGTVEDIYQRLRTGLDGTPMPSFADLIASNFLTDDQLWNVALYVRSLGPETNPPQVRDVVRAAQVEGAVPTAPDDSAWASVEEFYVPLVGQIIVKPRWFAPAVDGVWVKAVHNGDELAMRVRWSDPSNSPAPEWGDWRRAVTAAMQSDDAQQAATADGAGAQTGGPSADAAQASPPVQDAGGLTDQLVVQFPRAIPAGMERPYFLMGNTRDPVYLWRWQSQPASASEMLGKGISRLEPIAGAAMVSAQSVYDQGEWRVVFHRALAAADTTNRITFAATQPIPVAFFAWDGDNGESGTRGSISTWYFIYLEQPTPGTVYATPVLAFILTAGLGLFAVGRAQRRGRDADRPQGGA